MGDKSGATVLPEYGVSLSCVGHAVREQKRVLRREDVVDKRLHRRLVRLRLGGGGAEHLGKAEVFRLSRSKEQKNNGWNRGGGKSIKAVVESTINIRSRLCIGNVFHEIFRLWAVRGQKNNRNGVVSAKISWAWQGFRMHDDAQDQSECSRDLSYKNQNIKRLSSEKKIARRRRRQEPSSLTRTSPSGWPLELNSRSGDKLVEIRLKHPPMGLTRAWSRFFSCERFQSKNKYQHSCGR